ncbi:hypothetical protein [Citrobacter amalonaticus]
MCGDDYAADWRGTYDSEPGAKKPFFAVVVHLKR